uniref:ribonuclease H n=1 Tax=Gadus morhua TaxID=8049 RepID=A0A8C5CZT0_GADMO
MCRVVVGAPSLCSISPAAGTLPPSWGSSRGGEDPGPDQGKIPLAGGKEGSGGYCGSCPECQQVAPKPHFCGPLIPLPIISVPFSGISMDLVGPLPKSSRGHQYILVILDYATRYPEAIPLRTMASKGIASELVLMFSRVGIPEEILTDQGTPFMSRIMKDLCKLMQIKQLRTSVYHPQTDGLVERFNRTLKQMLKKVMEADGRNWDQLLPYLMFSIREVPQSSTGHSPFELLYGRRPRGLLDIAKEAWEQQPSPHRTMVEHVGDMRDRMATLWPLVREHMQEAQVAQARVYNRGAQQRDFQPGDKVLVLVPTTECKFLARWNGPYEVLEKVGEVNYRVRQPGRRSPTQIYHVNLLKKWNARDVLCSIPPKATSETGPAKVPLGEQLSPAQRQELMELVDQNQDVFSSEPGHTNLVQHHIINEPGKKVKLRPYRIPEARREAVRSEVKTMLEAGVIEESNSEWCSPIVLMPKPDGTIRFCNDFRKLNEISKFDAYPMPRIDELIERLGTARYISTLDLTKGYWQVPLAPEAREKTAFATPDGLFHYRKLPFGLHGAPPTFQRLMDRVLRPHRGYAAAYIDDIVIHGSEWDTHVKQVSAVLQALREAGLTANTKKCQLGLQEAEYLGYTIRRGCVKPQMKKVEAIQDWPRPLTKKQVRTFWGLPATTGGLFPTFHP